VATWYGKKAAGFAPGSPELEPTTLTKTRHGIASPTSQLTTTESDRTD
jgi:hypothetical protein